MQISISRLKLIRNIKKMNCSHCFSRLHLPDDIVQKDDNGTLMKTICLPNVENRPKQHLDEYLSSHYPQLVSRSKKELLSSSFSSFLGGDDRKNSVKVLNVLQGEIAHATSLQADAVISTDATTCHIVAFRSTTDTTTASLKSNRSRASSPIDKPSTGSSGTAPPLVTVAHVDKVGCTKSLYHSVRLHLDHHNKQQQEHKEEKPRILMEIHIVGGFLDSNGVSQAISTFLITLIVEVANHFQHENMHFTLSTVCISSMNTTTALTVDGISSYMLSSSEFSYPHLTNKTILLSPIVRGLGICPATGKIYNVNNCPTFLLGPAIPLRTARLWSSSTSLCGDDTLYLIHSTHNKEPSSSTICILPFQYSSHNEWLQSLLQMSDEEILLRTSTSPHCEGDDYCTSIKDAIRFMQHVRCTDLFGPHLDQPMFYVRNQSESNKWDLIGARDQEKSRYPY